MRTWSLSFLLLALAAVLFRLHRHAEAAVEDTCKAAAGGSPNIEYAFCVAALNSDPASGRADNKGLACIATGLSAANATSTKAMIKGLLKQKPEKKAKACLETCLELYTDAIPTLKDSLRELRSGRYEEAKMHLSSAVDAPVTCEDTFDEMGVASLLSKEDGNSQQLSFIALAITNML